MWSVKCWLEQVLPKRKIGSQKHKLDQNKDAEYWLLLGKSEALGNSIVDIIEEYAKENKLSEFQQKNLDIYKI